LRGAAAPFTVTSVRMTTRVGYVALGLLLATGACRRTHEPPVYESGPPAAPSAEPQVAAPAATGTAAAPETSAAAVHTPPALARRRPASEEPDGGTLNGDPRGLRPAEHQRVTTAALPRIQGCLDGAEVPAGDLPVTVHYTIEPPGYTGAVTVKATAPKEALDCIQGIVAGLQFGEFRGPKVEQDWSFIYHKTIKQVQVRADAGAAR
jgi:hypothetical protein